jgi:phosphate/sulfate permease
MAAAHMSLWALITLIAIAFLFDMMNGLHDAANSIATVVSTNVMSPRIAVLWAAFFNFIAFLVFGLNVAQTLGTGIVPEQVMDPQILVGALFGAIAWDAITWWGGIPSSSSHALVGGLVGAGLAKGGLGAVVWSTVLKTALAIIFSPLVGFVLALIMIAARRPGHWRDGTRFWSIAVFEFYSSVPRRFTHWAMAAMTPKRQWAISPRYCSRRATSVAAFMSPSGSSSRVTRRWRSAH